VGNTLLWKKTKEQWMRRDGATGKKRRGSIANRGSHTHKDRRKDGTSWNWKVTKGRGKGGVVQVSQGKWAEPTHELTKMGWAETW
jgi:hypothetical protein